MEWMLDIQLGRRNLSPIQKIAITEKYRPIYEKQAKENQRLSGIEYGNGGTKVVTKSSQPIEQIANNKQRNPTVRKILSDVAGVSEDTYAKGTKILNSDNEKLKQEVLSGEKSINAGYKELTGKKENQYITVPKFCDAIISLSENQIIYNSETDPQKGNANTVHRNTIVVIL